MTIVKRVAPRTALYNRPELTATTWSRDNDGCHNPTRNLVNGPFFLCAMLWSFPTAGQRICDERDNVLAHLAKKYQEQPIALGVTNTGGLVEVLTDGKGGSWTIIVTTPQGMSCLVAAGEGWRSMQQVAVEPEA